MYNVFHMATNHSNNKLSSDLYLGMIEVLKGFISKIRVDDGGWGWPRSFFGGFDISKSLGREEA